MKKQIKKLSRLFESFRNKTKTITLLSLPQFAGITLIDIGAAGDIEPRWKAVEKNLNYIGFEPDMRSRDQLMNNKHSCREYIIHPIALFDRSTSINLNLCRKPQVSSIYTPNTNFISRYPDPGRFDVLKTDIINTTKLDNITIKNPDFIKLDIQGAELNALIGGKKILKETFGLEIEVEFLPLYLTQPLFGDVTSFLSEHDFEFIDFVNLYRWERNSHNGHGHCVFGDALYLKSPEFIVKKKLGIARISSYLGILLLYKRFDLIRRVLELIPNKEREYFYKFENNLKRLEKTHNFARKISLFISRFLKFIDSDSRIHLLY
jgi:FkbM family methyltransferase